VTKLIAELKQGDPAAADRLFARYFDNLVRLAKQQLPANRRRMGDEEDVAQNAFASLVLGAPNGKHLQLTDRHDLWSLLIAITKHKATDLIKWEMREKRGGGKVRGESILDGNDSRGRPLGFAAIFDQAPTVTDLAEYDERLQDLLQRLDGADASGGLRQVATLKISGHSNAEIAKQLRRVERTVERKLERIREIWLEEFEE